MKFCNQCGAQLEDDAKFCLSCGAPVEEVPQSGAQQAQQVINQQVYTQQAAGPTYYENRTPAPSLKLPITALALGIAGLVLSLVLCWYGPFGLIGVGVSIAGLIIGNKAVAENPGARMGVIGRRLALAGIIAGGILTILFTILWIAGIGALANR